LSIDERKKKKKGRKPEKKKASPREKGIKYLSKDGKKAS